MNILRRITERILLRALRLGIRRRRLVFVGALGLAALVAANAVGLSSLGGLLGGGGGEDGRRAQGEPVATAMYLKGQELSDAKLVWEAYSDQAIREAQRRGFTLDDMQRQLDRAHQAGNRIEQVNYVGGYPISSGRSMHFYVVHRSDSSRREAVPVPVPVPYVFTLDASGKIDYIE